MKDPTIFILIKLLGKKIYKHENTKIYGKTQKN